MTLHDHGFRTRPAYDLPALARAMTDGIGPGGQALDFLINAKILMNFPYLSYGKSVVRGWPAP